MLTLVDLNFDPPHLPEEKLAEVALTRFGLTGSFEALPGERDQNALLTASAGKKFVLKISSSSESPDCLDFQLSALRHIEQVAPALPVPRVLRGLNGHDLQVIEHGGNRHHARLLSFLEGQRYQDAPYPSARGLFEVGRFQAKLAHALRGFFHPAARHFMPWDLRNGQLCSEQMVGLLNPGVRALTSALRDRFETRVMSSLACLRGQVIHHDGHAANLLRRADGSEAVAGIIDFGDMIHGPLILDLATSVSDFIGELDEPGDMQRAAQAICHGFHSQMPLEAEECDLLYDLVACRWLMVLQLFEFRRREMDRPPAFVTGDQPAIVRNLQCLLGMDRSGFSRAIRETCQLTAGELPTYRPRGELDDLALIQRRKKAMGPGYQLFYERPAHIVQGKGVWLYDADGHKYLDCYNNVASVGHCHPHVVEALARQASLLNTHTRYLHENVVRYAERLGGHLPEGLDTCLFVCTGTEANDLAFRIARAVTGKRGAVVMEDAYHGNSMVVTELSTAEYPAEDRPEYLVAVEAPNGYRGSIPYGETDAGPRYATQVADAVTTLARRGQGTAMFLCDTIFDANGAFTAPAGYLESAYAAVRADGGLCIADEVQAGLCRLGEHWWGFEDSGVVPDIVTMGKPIGDGHPLAVVATRREIAEEFGRNFGYFNTFGGNPVSAAVGMAVLDVIEQEDVLGNVAKMGQRLKPGLDQLQQKYPEIGDVRGKGLFWGLDVVKDADGREPDREQARRIRDFMREHGVLIGTIGPHDNILKIRPPLVFGPDHCDLLLDRLDEAFSACR